MQNMTESDVQEMSLQLSDKLSVKQKKKKKRQKKKKKNRMHKMKLTD